MIITFCTIILKLNLKFTLNISLCRMQEPESEAVTDNKLYLFLYFTPQSLLL